MESPGARTRAKAGSLPVLPHLVARLVGVVFIGLGAGLYSAAAPVGVVAIALLPALVAVAIVIHSSLAPPY